MFSGLGLLGSDRKNVLHLFSYCSKESYGCQVVFVPDVDYFGDAYRTRSSPQKEEEEPLGSIFQAVFL